jgi:low affinity Fe/Cu permease
MPRARHQNFTDEGRMQRMSRQTLNYEPAKRSGFNEAFRKVASCAASAVGSKWAFMLAVVIVLVWAATGPIFHFSDTWQLVINTGTTIVTFLMVFLIQNTQNRDAKAFHLKLDELIRGVKGARNRLVNLEELTDDELAALQRQFEHVREHAADRRTTKHAERIEERAHDAHRVASEANGASAQAEEVAGETHHTAHRDPGKTERAEENAAAR